VVHAFTGIAIFEFGQIEACTEMIAFAVNHGCAGFGGEVLKDVTQSLDQCITERITLGWAAQPNHSDSAMHIQKYTCGASTFDRRMWSGGHVESVY
jgi:hypothetical protein